MSYTYKKIKEKDYTDDKIETLEKNLKYLTEVQFMYKGQYFTYGTPLKFELIFNKYLELEMDLLPKMKSQLGSFLNYNNIISDRIKNDEFDFDNLNADEVKDLYQFCLFVYLLTKHKFIKETNSYGISFTYVKDGSTHQYQFNQ
jgi:hypothetical protein